MVNYICLYCKKKFDQRWNHTVHIKSCEIKFNKIINKYKKYNIRDMLKEYTNAIMKIKYLDNEFKCKNCFKIYESYNGLKNHIINKMCKREQIDLYDKIEKKYSIINKSNVNNSNNILNSYNTNTQNNYNINNNNNIKLVPYDDIKYDFLKPNVLKNAFEIPGEAFQSITADTFFDPEKKENHVIYCPNLKDGQIHVYNGNKFSGDGWDVIEKKEFFKQMITNQMRTLEKIKRCNDLDDNPLEINNIVGFSNLLKEFNANNDVIKEYTSKLNTLCWKNNPLIKKTKEESKEMKIQKMLQKALSNDVSKQIK